MEESAKEEFRYNTLIKQYIEIRKEIRTLEVLEMTVVILSILIFALMFTAAVLSNHYILLFISPALSMLLLLVAMSLLAYSTNLGLFASEVEDQLNEILHEPLVRWEQVVGVLGGVSTDFLTKKKCQVYYEERYSANMCSLSWESLEFAKTNNLQLWQRNINLLVLVCLTVAISLHRRQCTSRPSK